MKNSSDRFTNVQRKLVLLSVYNILIQKSKNSCHCLYLYTSLSDVKQIQEINNKHIFCWLTETVAVFRLKMHGSQLFLSDFILPPLLPSDLNSNVETLRKTLLTSQRLLSGSKQDSICKGNCELYQITTKENKAYDSNEDANSVATTATWLNVS